MRHAVAVRAVRSVAFSLCLLLLSLEAAAGACTPVSVYRTGGSGTPSFTYAVCGVPDFDQTRADLPNDGDEYCFPTATLDWLAYIAEHGEPSLLPSPERGRRYDHVSAAIAWLGVDMGTVPACGLSPACSAGTSGWGGFSGLETWIAQAGASAAFNVLSWRWSPSAGTGPPPLLWELVRHAVEDPGYADAVVGWYCDNHDPTHPGAVYRCGEHIVSVTAADSATHTVGISDPDSPGILGPPQSSFAQDVYTFKDESVTVADCGNAPGPCPGAPTKTVPMTHLLSYGHAYIDGALEISPALVATIEHNVLVYAVLSRAPEVRRQPVCLQCPPVTDLAVDPQHREIDYVSAAAGRLYRFDPLSGRITALASVGHPLQLVVGGYGDDIYVLTRSSLLRFDRAGRLLTARRLLTPADAIEFGDRSQRVVLLSRRQRALTIFSANMRLWSRRRLQGDVCPGSPPGAVVRVAENQRSRSIWAHCDGSTIATRIGVRGELTRVPLKSAHPLSGLFVDGEDHLFFSSVGRLVAFNDDGEPVASPATAALAVGAVFALSRDATNVNLHQLVGPAYREVTPHEIFHVWGMPQQR